MAGAGRRTFQPGEVLTASNVNSYLMDQSVMVFADSTARASAVGTAIVAGGMVSYMKDTNTIEAYDGSAWKQIAATTGSVLQVVSVTKTDTQSSSLAAGAVADISGLSITHTMKKSTNNLLLIVELGIVADSSQINLSGLRLIAGATPIGVGVTAGSRISVTSGMQNSPSASGSITKTLSATFLYSPASASAITYKAQIVNVGTSTYTHYVNRGVTDSDNQSWGRSISTLTLMEVGS